MLKSNLFFSRGASVSFSSFSLNKVLSFSVVLLPSLALFGNAPTVTGLVFLFILSLIFLKKEKNCSLVNVYPIVLTFVLVFLLSIPNVILDGGRLAALDVPSRYLLGAFIVLGLSFKRVEVVFLFYGIFFSSFLGFIIYPFYMGEYLGIPRYRGELFGNDVKILYIAYQSMVNMVISSVALLYFIRLQRYKKSFLSVISIALSLSIGLMSGSKVIMLALPIVLIFIFLSIKELDRRKKIISLIFVSLSLLFFVSILPHTQVYERASKDISLLDSKKKTSTNLRIEMIKFSWMSFKENPLFGMGYNKLGEYRNRLIDNGEINLSYSRNGGKGSLHTEVGNTAAKKGVVGLVFILFLYISPVYVAKKMYKKDEKNKFSFYLMLSFIATYFVAGLTESLLMTTSPSVYFILMVNLILLTMHKEKGEG